MAFTTKIKFFSVLLLGFVTINGAQGDFWTTAYNVLKFFSVDPPAQMKVQQELGRSNDDARRSSLFTTDHNSRDPRLHFSPNVSDFVRDKVFFYLYSRQNDQPESVTYGHNEPLYLRHLDISRPTIICTHGWRSDGGDMKKLKNKLLSKVNANVILVTWKDADNINYDVSAQLTVPQIGEWIAHLIDMLSSTESVKLSDIHLIGHSLGAHISGFAGKTVRENMKQIGKIGRISGLDPAGPDYEGRTIEHHLNKGDADFVDIIHTTKLLGYEDPIGDVDFYPDPKKWIEPSCESDPIGECAHNHAYALYTDSLTNANAYMAHPCNGEGSSIPMGYWVPKTASGKYCL